MEKTAGLWASQAQLQGEPGPPPGLASSLRCMFTPGSGQAQDLLV